MKTWAVLAVQHATLTSGIRFSAIPGLGAASLDGFALGALAAYFLALNSTRRGLSGPLLPLRTARRPVVKDRPSRSPISRMRTARGPVASAPPSRGLVARVRPSRGPVASAPPDRSPVPSARPSRSSVAKVRPSRRSMAKVRPSRRSAAKVQPSQNSTSNVRPIRSSAASSRRGRILARPALLPAPVPPMPERPEASRPYALPDRPEASRPYALPAVAGQPEPPRPHPQPTAAQPGSLWLSALPAAGPLDLPRPYLVAEPTGQPTTGRLSRIRRRIDVMLTEMLGDDSEEPAQSRPAGPDESFWGPGQHRESASPAGYRSKHRQSDPVNDPSRPESQRSIPRHAAPPASFGAKLTGRYAAHAG